MLRVVSLAWGLLSIIGMLVAFIPCFGWLNWIIIPFAVVGFIVSVLAYLGSENKQRTSPIIGLVACSTAVVFGSVRLFIGGGFF